MANAVQIAAQLYECRDAARTLLGDKYPERMREYGESIRSVAAVKGCGDLEAGKMLAEAAGGGMTTVLVLAAIVEIIEPSNVGGRAPSGEEDNERGMIRHVNQN